MPRTRKGERPSERSAEFFRTLVDHSLDIITVLDADGRIEYESPSIAGVLGYEPNELVGRDAFELIHPEDHDRVREAIVRVAANAENVESAEFRFRHADDSWRILASTGRLLPDDVALAGIVISSRDITEQRQAEQALRESESRFRDLAETVPDWIWEIDEAFRFTYASPRVRDLLGYEPDEMLGHTPFEFMAPEEARRVQSLTAETLSAHEPIHQMENVLLHKDGHPVDIEISGIPIFDENGVFRGYRGIDRDISERKRVEAALKESEALLAYAEHVAGLGSWQLELRSGAVTWSAQMYRLFRRDPAEGPMSLDQFHQLLDPDERERFRQAFSKIVETGKAEEIEYKCHPVADLERYYLARFETKERDGEGRPRVLAGTVVDVTERKLREIEINRLARLLDLLRRCNALLVREDAEGTLLSKITDLVVEDGRYPLAIAVYLDDKEAKSLRKVQVKGPAAGYAEDLELSFGDAPSGQRPIGQAIRAGQPAIVRSIANDPSFGPGAARAAQHGLHSAAAFPLLADGHAFGALVVYSGEARAFDDDETSLLRELTDDLAFGIAAIRQRRLRSEAEAANLALEKQLDEALLQTIDAITRAAETRDPYTAGHEREVARMAEALGRELGLSDFECEGLRVAGLLHDIGKLQIPMEILARPTRLSAVEYAVVKTHAEIGYNILKEVAFPWCIAEVILQHHERLDGSGYPKGLSGEEIGLGGRILAVADTVEAMGNHRPYRPSRGIDAALLHVLQERGKLYDPATVDACLALFEKKGYQLHRDNLEGSGNAEDSTLALTGLSRA